MSATDNLDHLLAEYNAKLSNVMPQAVAFNVGLFTACSVSQHLSSRKHSSDLGHIALPTLRVLEPQDCHCPRFQYPTAAQQGELWLLLNALLLST